MKANPVFSLYIPTKLVFGCGEIKKLSSEKLPGKKALVVISSGTSMRKYGYLERVLAQLRLNNVETLVYDKILPNPIKEHVMEAAAICREEKCDFVVGLGGGSSIDSAKSIAVMACNDGDYWDYVSGGSGKGRPVTKALPIIAIPTTAGTGTEMDPWTVITHETAQEKIGFGCQLTFPTLSIVDPELMYSMPKGLTAATGMDALTHAIESYITPGAWAMSDMFELKAIEMIAANLKAAVDNGNDTAAREAMSQAQYIAGMGFSNVGLGIVHSMAHPLGAHYDTPHGVANALLLPYVMEYNAESPAAPKYIHIAKAMGVDTVGMTEAEGVRAAVDAVRKLSLSIGIPQKLHEINVKEEDLHQLAVDAFNDVCTGGNPRPTSVEDIETCLLYTSDAADEL